ncbi:MAG: DUF192 domain-containing protein [Candidatus Magasanikbacteria bacterium]|jgi:uncharacterized protein|nr:DUF192 domain-containing protein [Candidatus Magasanikbacteria bacterium]
MSKQNRKKKYKIWYSWGIVVLFVLSLSYTVFMQYRHKEAIISFEQQELHVQIAHTPKQWHRGLGKKETIAPYDGMLFLFPFSRRHGIVMRDMGFPIDIVWLDRGTIIDIAPQAQPQPEAAEADLYVYYPRMDATMVLELEAGKAAKIGLKIGDTMNVVEE